MYIPLVRERVQVRNRSGEFVVISADYVRQVAHVKKNGATDGGQERVPFDDLFATWESPDSTPSSDSDSATI